MTAFDAYDPDDADHAYDASADLLNVLRASCAGQRLAARLLPAVDGATRSEAAAPHADRPGSDRAERPDQSRHRPLSEGRSPTAALSGPVEGQPWRAPADPLAAWLSIHDGMVHSGLKARLLSGGGVFTTVDPDGLARALEASNRFRRDTRLGGLLHDRKISFREVARTDSLHVVIDGNKVWTHIDRISPLNLDPEHAGHYSPLGILAHNVAGVGDDLILRLRRRQGGRPVGPYPTVSRPQPAESRPRTALSRSRTALSRP
ncbi:MAG: hypothetical protein M3083_20585, partial [Actinomycetota bacterium]|nr:hypothetical protein [Actinomycetota bacterium]